MARAVLATTRNMLQGAIKRDAWLEIMVAWAETPVANHELLLSCFDFIAKMMAGGVSISRVVAGANKVVTGASREVMEANRVVAEHNCPDAVVSTDFRGALSVVLSLIMALVNVISMKIFCHVCVFY